MSESKKRHSLLFRLSVCSSVISSLSLLAVILNDTENKHLFVVFGMMFWIGLILEQIFFQLADRIMKISCSKNKRKVQDKIGIFSLPVYMEGFTVDVVFIASLNGFVICMVFDLGKTYIQYILVCFMVLSFRLHCFFNGKNYKYMKSKER